MLSAVPATGSRAQELIFQHRKGFDGWFAAVRAKDDAEATGTPEELRAAQAAYQVADEAYDMSTSAIFNHIPQTLYEASIIASHLGVHARAGHFDLERLFDLLEAFALAPVAEAPSAPVAAAALAWQPKVFADRPVPVEFDELKASFWAMQGLADTLIHIGNVPRSKPIGDEIDDWLDGVRVHQDKIVQNIQSVWPNTTWDADAKAEIALTWAIESGLTVLSVGAVLSELSSETQRIEDAKDTANRMAAE